MRLFLDTNVMLDLFAEREGFYEGAAQLKVMGFMKDAELWVSAKSFTDVFYLMKKDFKSSDVQDIILENLEYLRVCSLARDELVEAARRKWPDFEDCLIDVCAEKVKADFILTRDRKGFSRSRTRVMSPKDFLDYLENEVGIVYDLSDF